ncbi:hypothetical protein BLL36_26715 [Pseudomonas cedrina subsp. cedrina]|uniref:Uncharacterized protein n=1 Tax=Pseudomonas cedrina subsp. cedrina TaxID=76762 RepID=A0A1V2JXS6_PSECE|nr:hypothetical protein BLL36_26715 [Pseudomonas cedrina subsp. cedrina]
MVYRFCDLFCGILLTFLVLALGGGGVFLSVGTNVKFFLLKEETFFKSALETAWEETAVSH